MDRETGRQGSHQHVLEAHPVCLVAAVVACESRAVTHVAVLALLGSLLRQEKKKCYEQRCKKKKKCEWLEIATFSCYNRVKTVGETAKNMITPTEADANIAHLVALQRQSRAAHPLPKAPREQPVNTKGRRFR